MSLKSAQLLKIRFQKSTKLSRCQYHDHHLHGNCFYLSGAKTTHAKETPNSNGFFGIGGDEMKGCDSAGESMGTEGGEEDGAAAVVHDGYIGGRNEDDGEEMTFDELNMWLGNLGWQIWWWI